MATDRHYLPHAGATIASILSNAAADDRLVLHVLNSDLTPSDQKQMAQVVKPHLSRCELAFVRMDAARFRDLPIPSYVTMATYFRLTLQEIFPTLDRLIYLDVDLLVLESLRGMWEIPLGNNLLGAVEDSDRLAKVYAQIGLAPGVRFNAGVLLVNLSAMRKQAMWDQYMSALKMFEDKCVPDDQMLLNHVCAQQTVVMPYRWNHTTSIYREVVHFSHYDTDEIRQAILQPAIVHFTGRRKPWMLKRDRHRHAMAYWTYLWRTPWWYRCRLKFIKQLQGRKHPSHCTYQQLMQSPARKV